MDLGREYTRRGTSIESWEEMKQKLKENYFLDSYKQHLLNKLHSLRQDNRSAQECTIDFDDLTLYCEVQEDSYYRSGLRSDI